MFAYELHRARHADLVRQAEAHRLAGLVRNGRRARRTTVRRPGGNGPEGPVNSTGDSPRSRFARAA
ncbi:hypothetical protein [Streptomyces sp. NRRL S-118]|uniref:hypothetical protein n=1 Tax=Streptomyces sp. NRRL S-118 TaxID=1463881 RepID=UPI0004C4CC55|nr:hypothetical protein [Streptomyces sp. NRRL S-118]